MTDGMISLEPNSSAVYFPLHKQQQLLDRNIQETRDGTKVLLSGLRMTVVSAPGRGAFVQSESAVQYANKEYLQRREGPKVPLLETGRGASIAGVRIRSEHEPITDLMTRKKIEEAVAKKLLSVEYTIQNPGKGP